MNENSEASNALLMSCSRVALPKLFLWNAPTRYQEYP